MLIPLFCQDVRAKMRSGLLLTCGVLLLSGCASMSRSECRSADWLLRGIEDGRQGSATSRVDRHAKACAKVDVIPDRALYVEGHSQGVRAYCVPEVGLKEGRNNSHYNDVCPADLEAGFLRSYIDGLQIKLSNLEIQAQIANTYLSNLRLEQAALGGNTNKKLRADINAAENSLSNANRSRLDIQRKIANLRLRITN